MNGVNGPGWTADSWPRIEHGGPYPLLLVAISMACLSLGATLMYVVYSRRFRLNWFERNRLDSLACEETTVVKLCNRPRYHSGSTCSGGSLADLTVGLPPIGAPCSASRSSSLSKLQSCGGSAAAGDQPGGVPSTAAAPAPPGGGSTPLGATSRGVVTVGGNAAAADVQSLRSVGSSASVATSSAPTATTTAIVHALDAAVQPLISAASSEHNVGSDLSPCSDVSSVIQKYVQPSAGTASGSTVGSPGSTKVAAGVGRPKVSTMYEKIDHTKFNADMYRVEDTTSVGGGEEMDGPSRIHFSLTYTAHFSVLCVRVVNASGLAASAPSGEIANPYLKVRLIPESKTTAQPKLGQIQHNTREPHFDEDFIFNGITFTDLNTKILEILIMNHVGGGGGDDAASDRSSLASTGSLTCGDECLGGIHWSLDQMVDPMREHNIKPLSLDLPLCSAAELRQNTPSHGELQLSMSYLQSAERLTVSVLRARSLPTVGPEHKKAGDAPPDVFIKLTVTSTSGKSGKVSKKKKKTNVQKNTTCPSFNEAFTFNMSHEALRTASLQIVVAHEVPPSLPLQQRELALARLTIAAGCLDDCVQSAGSGVQAKWFRLAGPSS